LTEIRRRGSLPEGQPLCAGRTGRECTLEVYPEGCYIERKGVVIINGPVLAGNIKLGSCS